MINMADSSTAVLFCNSVHLEKLPDGPNVLCHENRTKCFVERVYELPDIVCFNKGRNSLWIYPKDGIGYM